MLVCSKALRYWNKSYTAMILKNMLQYCQVVVLGPNEYMGGARCVCIHSSKDSKSSTTKTTQFQRVALALQKRLE